MYYGFQLTAFIRFLSVNKWVSISCVFSWAVALLFVCFVHSNVSFHFILVYSFMLLLFL